MTRLRIFAFLLALALLHPAPTFAYLPESESHPIEIVCNDRAELAGVLMVEGGAQPTADIIRMGEIIKAEADSRGLTVCALSRFTNFLGVRHYISAHPDSYAARRFASPPEWALDLADGILTDQFEDLRDGAMHFNGDGQRIIFKP